MQRALKAGRRTVAAIAIAAVVGAALSASAWAGAPYTAHIHLGRYVKLNESFEVEVYGNSPKTSRLRVFLNRTRTCSIDAMWDASYSGNFLKIDTTVTGKYKVIRHYTATSKGRHYFCAYLAAPPAKFLRASAHRSYFVY